MIRRFITATLVFISFSCQSYATHKTTVLYNSLDPFSVSQHLAFYELYPQTPEGKQALMNAWQLLTGTNNVSQNAPPLTTIQSSFIDKMIKLVNKQPNAEPLTISARDQQQIERLAYHLPNRRLKGNKAKSEEEVLALDSNEIDLTRALFLCNESVDGSCYEAMIDLMALQILAKLTSNATPQQKIQAMNVFIFDEMGYRFPPHSQYARDIDEYTFLPSVLDSRQGVCLGVSILYMCLAQRLNLPLEVITPPGHIYVRYREGDTIINIETTARGIHLDSETYLGINTPKLEERTVKEVVGMSHFNQAGGFLGRRQYDKALEAYKKSQIYMPDDILIKELMGYTYLLSGEEEKGRNLLQEVANNPSKDSINANSTVDDYLNGFVKPEALKPLFDYVDETRKSVLEKKKQIQQVVKKHPKFRAGLFSLATCWLQLHRQGEALEALETYHKLDNQDPTAEYYLATLYATRYDYNKAWEHLNNAEKIVEAANFKPKALKSLRKQLALRCPE